MADENHERRPVYQCTPDESRRTLAVNLAPTGDMTKQLQVMTTQAKQFGSKLKHSRLTGLEAIIAMNSRIMRTLSYPLVTTTLTKKQCQQIMTPILYSVLGKAKIVRTIARAVLYGPKKYQGMGFLNLYVYQDSVQLSQFM